MILSDTFEQFASPLMAKLGYPTLFCHELEISPDGAVSGYRLRMADQKRKSVEAFRSLNFKVISTGDSYNDLSMLRAADNAVLFRPTEKIRGRKSGPARGARLRRLKRIFSNLWAHNFKKYLRK